MSLTPKKASVDNLCITSCELTVENHPTYPQPVSDNPAQSWDKVLSLLSKELSEQSFKTWFYPVTCLELDESLITLGVPDSYYGGWLKTHYQDLIKSALTEALGHPREIKYVVVESAPVAPSEPEKQASAAPVSSPKPAADKATYLNEKYTFKDFVVGPGNRFAHAAALAVCEAPAKQYNPLFVYGPVGLGKTHLLQSIAHELKRRNPGFKALYISSEKFTNQLITAIQTRTTNQFRTRYRNLDLLLIDDIHFIAEKEATQEEFFHTFNTLYDAHKQIIVCSDRPPREIPGLEERLVSRFGWGLVTDIQPPDFETRVAILKKKMEKETITVPDEVLYFIASKIKSNIRELEGALVRVVAYCTLTSTLVTLPVAEDILKSSLKEEEEKITLESIQRTVASYFNLKVSDLRAKRRSRSLVRPRQIAMYLIRSLTEHSLPEIGEYFGGKDHTTVLHSFNKISDSLAKDVGLRREVDEITDLLKRGS